MTAPDYSTQKHNKMAPGTTKNPKNPNPLSNELIKMNTKSGHSSQIRDKKMDGVKSSHLSHAGHGRDESQQNL